MGGTWGPASLSKPEVEKAGAAGASVAINTQIDQESSIVTNEGEQNNWL